MAQQKKPETEEKKEVPFGLSVAQRGYPYLNTEAVTEDLQNPAEDYITIGYADANGIRHIAITLPKAEALARAEAILKKYGGKK